MAFKIVFFIISSVALTLACSECETKTSTTELTQAELIDLARSVYSGDISPGERETARTEFLEATWSLIEKAKQKAVREAVNEGQSGEEVQQDWNGVLKKFSETTIEIEKAIQSLRSVNAEPKAPTQWKQLSQELLNQWEIFIGTILIADPAYANGLLTNAEFVAQQSAVTIEKGIADRQK